MVTTGQYNVVNCGGNAALVVGLLNNLYASLLPVIQDAKSTISSPAYKAFFKDPSSANLVSTLFTNITTGVPLTPPAPYSSNGAAAFLCVTAPHDFIYKIDGRRTDAYTECLADPAVAADYLGFNPPKQYIIICPSFFTSDIASIPPPSTCLPFNMYTNGFLGNGQRTWWYKMWILLGMLVHYYLHTSTGSNAVTNIDDANQCLQLSPEQSSLNANNYIYYAASKSHFGCGYKFLRISHVTSPPNPILLRYIRSLHRTSNPAYQRPPIIRN